MEKSTSLFRALMVFAVLWSIYSIFGAFAFWKMTEFYGQSSSPVAVSSITPYLIPLILLGALLLRFRGSTLLFGLLLLIPSYWLIKMTVAFGLGLWNGGTILLLALGGYFIFKREAESRQTMTEQAGAGNPIPPRAD